MKKGVTYEGIVERIDFPNKGMVQVLMEDGTTETALVKNVLPGQKVSFRVNKNRKKKAEGVLLEVLEKSPMEKEEAVCPHFGKCGGCTYISLPYEEQLQVKEGQIRNLLAPYLEENPEIFEGIKASPVIYGYRNKMEFTFGDEVKDGPLALGMHKRGSFYDLVSVRSCQIVDEDYRKILGGVLDYFAGTGLPFFHRLTHVGYLRHLLVRKASRTGEILVALVTTTQQQPDLTGFTVMLRELPLEGKIVGILHIENDSVADVIQSDRTELLYGQDYFYEELLGLRFRISPFSFFQTNSYSAEVLYETVREYVGNLNEAGEEPDKTVFDLYSGTGTIAQLMAPVAKKVIGVEIVEEAVKAARENARDNGLDNCEFIAGDVLRVLDDLEQKPDMIILDPPRDGIHPKAIGKILGYGVKQLVYISCKPTSLARDLEAFYAAGYRMTRCVSVDQFPWTTGIETVALLIKT